MNKIDATLNNKKLTYGARKFENGVHVKKDIELCIMLKRVVFKNISCKLEIKIKYNYILPKSNPGEPWGTLGNIGEPWGTLGNLGEPWGTLGNLGVG